MQALLDWVACKQAPTKKGEKTNLVLNIRFNHSYITPLPAPTDTRNRILTAAESLFAQYGYGGVSLRQITVAAKVNVASVNYHFFDKEGLYRDLLRLRLRQINQVRLGLLEAAQARAGDRPVPLPEIFDALARPLFFPSPETAPLAPRLLGRLLSERQPFADDLVREEFQPAMTRFGQAIRRHQPALPPADFIWRLSFVIGALHHALTTLPDMALHTGGLCQAGDCAAALKNFSDFSVKAFST